MREQRSLRGFFVFYDAARHCLAFLDTPFPARAADFGLGYDQALFKEKCDNIFEWVLDYANQRRKRAA